MNRVEAGKLGWQASKNTRDKQLKDRLEKYGANPNRCNNCNNVIPYKKRINTFCSHTCAAIYNNGRRGTIARPRPKCLICNNKIGKNAKKFCSTKCQHILNRMKRLKRVLKDKSFPKNMAAKTMKSILLEIRSHQCEICEEIEWMNKPIPLIMDHINGSSDDHRLINLRLVCGNCDMQLPTYKSKNKGNGRHYRRQRYKDGKSY